MNFDAASKRYGFSAKSQRKHEQDCARWRVRAAWHMERSVRLLPSHIVEAAECFMFEVKEILGRARINMDM